MSEKIYFDADTAYDSGTLYDWYLASVDNSLPIWTELHIDELFNDFYVIPKDTKPADVAPVVHGHWVKVENARNVFKCSRCGHIRELRHIFEIISKPKLCEECGAKMDEEVQKDE